MRFSSPVFQSIQLNSNIFSLRKIKVSEDRDKVIKPTALPNNLDSMNTLCRAGLALVWVAGHSTQQVYISTKVPHTVGEIGCVPSHCFRTHSTHVAF